MITHKNSRRASNPEVILKDQLRASTRGPQKMGGPGPIVRVGARVGSGGFLSVGRGCRLISAATRLRPIAKWSRGMVQATSATLSSSPASWPLGSTVEEI